MKVENPKKGFTDTVCMNCMHYIDSMPFLSENGNRSSRIIHATLNFFLSFALVVFMLGVFTHTVQAQSVVDIVEGDEWRYLKGPKEPPSKWNHIGFGDSGWHRGPSRFGYGNSNNNTVLEDMQGNYRSIYARREFTVNNPAVVTGMTLTIICDGPFIAYLNGIEVARSDIQWTEQIDIDGFTEELLPVTNVLAIQCFNDDINSRSFSFIPSFRVF